MTYFAKKYFNDNERKDNVFAKICFFKAHPKINGEFLDYAVARGVLSRKDFSNDIINPVEVTKFYKSISIIVKLREREGQRVDLGRSLKGHLWMVDGGWWYTFP